MGQEGHHVAREDPRPKIYLLGESRGSVIGVHLAARHPGWFHAYLGVGQVSNVRAYMDRVYSCCERNARAENNEKALKQLSSPGRPSPEMSARQTFRSLQNAGRWMDRYLARKTGLTSLAGFFFKSLWEAPEYSFFDFQLTLQGYVGTQKKIIKELMTVDLETQVPTLGVPVYFVMGEHDLW
jgi:proline iminopeptidase